MDKKHIANPLTIIGVFCSIAEIAGTVVLIAMSGVIQYIFLGFVIGFPVLLVLLFFNLLKSDNYYRLYSPSDYSDPEMFFKMFEKVTDIRNRVDSIILETPETSVKLESVKTEISNMMEAADIAYNGKGYAIFNMIAESPNGIKLSEITKNLGRSYTKRVLSQLLEKGFIISESAQEKSEDNIERTISIYRINPNRGIESHG
jgi:hypothetical protein